jgi:rod shape determining protein RodA
VITDRSATLVRNRDMSAAWRHVDLSLCVAVALTSIMGLAMVYSATAHRASPAGNFERQLVFVTLGVGVMAAVASLDYVKLRDWARLIYLAALAGLVLVLAFGREINGTKGWFDIGPIQIQPAEVAKVALIVSAASYLGSLTDRPRARELLACLLLFGVPMGLIMLQPDLGTTLVFLVVAAGMLLVGGFPARTLAVLGLVGVLAVGGILSSDMLDDYQKDRLTSFANPDGSDSAAVYNTRQAQIAIAAGGFSGQGYLEGEQTKGGFVPEQETDFIFTVAAEELGFLGAGFLLVLLGVIVWRVWRTAALARDQVGRLMCVGVLCMVVFHIFQNAGMSLGIMPVTGIPLPFVSYGGSSILSMFAAMGLVLNVHMRRFS